MILLYSLLISCVEASYATHDKLDEIARNTEWSFWQDGICFIAIISLFLSFATVLTLYREFRKDRLDSECQRKLFHDIVRHLYRNKICALSMRIKYERCLVKNKKFTGYPCEEHYKKMQLLPDDIHLERYNRNANMHQKMHELELLLRNYNTEIEVAEGHMLNSHIGLETKIRDFETLDFKTGYLTKRIYDVMQEIYKNEDVKSQIQEIIYESHTNNLKSNDDESLWGKGFVREVAMRVQAEEGRDYLKNFFNNCLAADRFLEGLQTDLVIECGQNRNKSEKIHIINLI